MHIGPLLLKSDYTGQNIAWTGKVREASWLLHKFLHARVISRKPRAQQSLERFDDKILSLYVHGMTAREIQAHLQEMYGAEVSPTLISTVTDAVVDEAKAWQSRPLDALYSIVYLRPFLKTALIHRTELSVGFLAWKSASPSKAVNTSPARQFPIAVLVGAKLAAAIDWRVASLLLRHRPKIGHFVKWAPIAY